MATNNCINTTTPVSVASGGTNTTTFTEHGVLSGSGATAPTPAAVGTDGQVFLGASTADGAFATLASSGGTVTFTPGTNTLNLEAAGGGLEWSEATGTTQQMANGEGYIANNAAEVALTLPATASVGASVAVVGKGAGGWKIAQNASQYITVDDVTTTAGTSNYLTADDDKNCLELVCATANTWWIGRKLVGTFTAGGGPSGAPATWTARTSGFGTDRIRGAAYDGSTYWVTVGQNGKLFTATDPTSTWTSRTSSFSTTEIQWVAYGNGYFVAVSGLNKLATAPDPTSTWTQNAAPGFSGAIYGCAYGGGYWVACGDNGEIATATDPTSTWTQRTSNLTGGSYSKSVAYGDGVWVVTNSGTDEIATATDPTGTWTKRNTGVAGSSYQVAYGADGYWVISGPTDEIVTATDPTGSWTSRANPFTGATTLTCAAYGASAWTTVSYSNELATATDPTSTWTSRTSNADGMFVVAYGGGYWVAAGLTGKLSTAVPGA